MDEEMKTDMAECNCEGCAAHMEGDQKGECTCTNANCKCAMCGKAPAEEAPVAA